MSFDPVDVPFESLSINQRKQLTVRMLKCSIGNRYRSKWTVVSFELRYSCRTNIELYIKTKGKSHAVICRLDQLKHIYLVMYSSTTQLDLGYGLVNDLKV